MQKSLIAPPPPQPSAVETLLQPPTLAAFLAALSIALLLGAFGFEYIGGIKPCHLCLGQRLPWPIMTIVAGAAMLGVRRGAHPMLAPAAFAAAALIAVWSAYLGAFHAGVEWKWWPGPPTCTGTSLPSSGGLGFNPSDIIKCDEIAWSLFGISLAGYNFIFSLVALAAAGLGLLKTVRRA
ncbi:MAG: disulfide bond formation protein B [Alphaproteobacteria bacterium]|nr:disulfide bond formation protein B [Alphaproteobacteria bacterium]